MCSDILAYCISESDGDCVKYWSWRQLTLDKSDSSGGAREFSREGQASLLYKPENLNE